MSDTRRHNLGRSGLSKSENAFEHFLVLVGFDIGHFESIGQIVGGDVLCLLGDNAVHDVR